MRLSERLPGLSAAAVSEDVFEVLHAVRLEKHKQDEGPEAKDEAVGRVPVFLFGLLKKVM